jgi:hypothetical protein
MPARWAIRSPARRHSTIGLVDGLWDANREEECLSSCVQRVLSRPGVPHRRARTLGQIAFCNGRTSPRIPRAVDSSSDTHACDDSAISRETIAKAITVGLEQGFAEGCPLRSAELLYGLLSQADVQQGLQRFAPRKPASSS